MKPHLHIVHPNLAGGAACPSGGAPAQGEFCSRCGESITVHAPTAGEFIHEFVGHFVALEGKLWATLRLLMFAPGRLTADFLRGRRVPYVNPLRLYLSLSLVVFALIKLNGVDLPQITIDQNSASAFYRHKLTGPAIPKQTDTVTLTVKVEGKSEAGEAPAMTEAISRLGAVNPAWAANARRFMSAPPAERADILNHGFLANLPYMLIGALPLFALYLKLLYRGSRRRYGEHLVFALHANAFAFLLASVMILIPGNLVWLIA